MPGRECPAADIREGVSAVDSFIVPSAALACACIAASAALLWRRLRGRPRAYCLVNLLFPAAQLMAVALAAWATVAFGASAAYSLVTSALGMVAAGCNAFLFADVAATQSREAAAAFTDQVAKLLEAQREHLLAAQGAVDDADRIRGTVGAGLDAAEQAIHAGDTDTAREALEHLVARIPSKGASWCRNPALDALLLAKAAQAKEAGIAFEAQVSLPSTLPLPDAEVCAVLANLIDNALAACEALPESCRFVRVSAAEHAGFVALAVRNPVTAGSRLPNERWEKRRQMSASASLPEHGWGIEIAEDIVRAHEGSLTFELEGPGAEGDARPVLVARAVLRAG